MERTRTQQQARIGKLPGKIQEIDVGAGTMIVDVLAQAQLEQDGYELRLNGSPAEIKEMVKPGDTVLLVKKIKGN